MKAGSPAPATGAMPAGADATGSSHTARGRSTGLDVGIVVGVISLYALLAVVAYWPVSPLSSHHLVDCACSDPAQEVWFLKWTPFAVAHGLDPLFTSYLNVPKGTNLGINTSMPLLGLLAAPLTALAGPVATYNFLLRLAFAVSATAMFLVLRRYTRWWPAAFGGGLLYGFSPFMIGHGFRHLFLVFAPIPPLLMLLVDRWLIRRSRPALRSGLYVGLAAGAQYLISPEVLLITGVGAVVALAAAALRHPRGALERARSLLTGSAAAAAAFVAVAGYAVFMLLAGPQRTIGPPHAIVDLIRYHADLLSPLIPTASQLLSPTSLRHLGNSFVAGNLQENGLYLGLPLLILLGFLVYRCRRVGLVVSACLVGAVAFVISLGPVLTVAGHRIGGGWLPSSLLTHLPLLQDGEPARYGLLLQLCAAVILAVGLDRVHRDGWTTRSRPANDSADPGPGSGSRRRAAAVGVVGALAMAPLIPRLPYQSAPIDNPAFFSSPEVRTIPIGAVALTFPYDVAPQNSPMLWQVASDMRFKILGGDVFVPAANGRGTFRPVVPADTLALQVLLAGGPFGSSPLPAPAPQTLAALRELLVSSRVDVVLVDPNATDGAAVAVTFTYLLGAPTITSGGMDVWTAVRHRLGVAGS